LDELLVSHGINNIGYYTGDEDFVRDRKKNYKQELHQIEESEEEFLAKSPKAVVEQVDVLQEIPRISPKASPKASPKGSLHSKTVKNKLLSRRTREGLRQAMNLAAVITDDKVKHLRDGDVRVKTVAPRVVGPSFRLPSRDRLPFKP
jgi:hypothetical protein